MTAPLCACGCGTPVKWGPEKRGWRTYASKACCGRAIGPRNHSISRVTEAHQEYQKRCSEARYARLWAVLRDLKAGRIELEAAVEAVALQQRRAYQRGFGIGKRQRLAA